MDAVTPAVFTIAEKRANCAACLLSSAMRDCPLCAFHHPEQVTKLTSPAESDGDTIETKGE